MCSDCSGIGIVGTRPLPRFWGCTSSGS